MHEMLVSNVQMVVDSVLFNTYKTVLYKEIHAKYNI